MNKSKTLYSEQAQLLSQWLIKKRKEKNLSIRKLALLLNWPSSILGKIETGDRRLDVIEFLEICDALDINPKEGIDFIQG